MTAFCAAVDWGTTSFRLWLFDHHGNVLGETHSGDGLKQAQSIGFDKLLEQHLSDLGTDAHLPVIICGMAGSRQGWQEAAYLDTPASLYDCVAHAVSVGNGERAIKILPGIAQRDAASPDVIRGEETLLLGLESLSSTGSVVCMPGTHSKWVKLDAATVKGFSTFMTGELYEVLAKHSILSMGLEGNADASSPGFRNAVLAAIKKPQEITNQLFMGRSAGLLGFDAQMGGASGISGSVIGLEIAGALSKFGPTAEVQLVASGALLDLYKQAFSICGIATTTTNSEAAAKRGLFYAAQQIWADTKETKTSEA